jgi:hypothetical protein
MDVLYISARGVTMIIEMYLNPSMVDHVSCVQLVFAKFLNHLEQVQVMFLHMQSF